MTKKILILNTGGTFNKTYDAISGKLRVPKNNIVIKTILTKTKILNLQIDGLIYKDSLDINNSDRKELIKYIKNSKYKNIIIIHGTDTINLTASFLEQNIKNKRVVLTGAMKPFNIEPIEATSNLSVAIGFLQNCKKDNIYICMHGLIKKHTKIKKNKELGIFQYHK